MECALFHPWNKNRGWADNPQVAFADAVMVGLCRNLERAERLISKKAQILESTKELFLRHEDGTFTGRGNSKADVNERIDLFDNMIRKVASE